MYMTTSFVAVGGPGWPASTGRPETYPQRAGPNLARCRPGWGARLGDGDGTPRTAVAEATTVPPAGDERRSSG